MMRRYLNSAIMSSRFEARTLIVSTFLLSISAMKIPFAVLILVFLLNVKYVRALTKILPIFIQYSIFCTIFGGFDKIPNFLAMLSLYLLLHNSNVEEIASALMWFRFPPIFAYSICMSLRMFQNISEDLDYLLKIKRFEGFNHLELLKRLTNIAILRTLAMTESLHSREFDLKSTFLILRKPRYIDIFLLSSSVTLFLLSLLSIDVL